MSRESHDREEERISDLLTAEQSRHFRVLAWRHVRRINSKIAREVWSRNMSLVRYAKRKDANQRPIVEALERVGAEVWILDRPADLMVWFRQKWFVAEVKPATGRFTKLQQSEREQGLCRGILTWRSPLEALQAIGATK